MLAGVPAPVVEALRRLFREVVLERLRRLALRRLPLAFYGLAFSIRRCTEETAVDYNKKRKGELSYYPLFCTVALATSVRYHQASWWH